MTSARDHLRAVQTAEPVTLPPPTAPVEVAESLLADRFTAEDGTRTLRRWRGGWWRWDGPRWVEMEQHALDGDVYSFTRNAVYQKGEGVAPWEPNRRKVTDLLHALAALVHLRETAPMPSWLDGSTYDGLVVSVSNGLLDVGARELLEHDPRFFNATSVPFAYDPDAPVPMRWYRFLDDLWGEDEASVSTLAEWFGYVVSGRLDLQKILLIVGPTRAGKGVIARTLRHLVGADNYAGPTLSSFAGDFGLSPLLGKSLAVVSDARLNGRGAHVVVERLLSISGEDPLTVNRKYRDQWTGQLPCRLMLCSNELPQLGDASMAVAGRFVPLLLTKTWYGQEDRHLEESLIPELPGILNWALDGLGRLTQQDRFTQPPHVEETIRALEDLASPVNAFIRDRCVTGPDEEVARGALYAIWRTWAEENGQTRTSQTVFGRDLRAAVGGRLRTVQLRDGDGRQRAYRGIGLK